MTYQPMTREQIAAIMRDGNAEITEAHFYDMIDESLNAPAESRQWPYYALDFVGRRGEWENFKAAMTRWMADQDRDAQEGWDQAEAELAYEREQRHLKPVED